MKIGVLALKAILKTLNINIEETFRKLSRKSSDNSISDSGQKNKA